MAKKTGKKARKSGKTKSKHSQVTESAPPQPAPEKTPKPARNKDIVSCQFCNKAMKDERTRKIHERNCGAKSTQSPVHKEKDIETVLMALNDRFEDERQYLARNFQEKEDNLQKELDEVKTVLRMEIDRHRKELERISKVEKEMADNNAPQETMPEAPHHPKMEEIPVHSSNAVPEPPRARNHAPRAIDMVPMRIPTLPKRNVIHQEIVQSIPDLDEEIPAAPQTPGLDRATVEEIIRETMEKYAPKAAAPTDTGNLEKKLSHFAEGLGFLETKMDRNISELRKSIERAGKNQDTKKIEKDLDKISDKVQDIIEDSGYGESLSVSKIPPNILEIVYQAIMDDVYIEIIHTKGAQDAERLARTSLEEVRLKTSGSELFKFDGRKIVTDSLAKSIEANMISARQIQTTYDVLMDRLLEAVPHHKAKNFKGMIKVKSQEFAVDRATKHAKELVKLEKIIDSTSQMVAAMAANVSAQNLDIHEKINQLQSTSLASKAEREDVDALRLKLDEINERLMRLADEVATLTNGPEANVKDEEKSSGDVFLTPGEEPFVPEPDVPADGVFTAQPPKLTETDEDTLPPSKDEIRPEETDDAEGIQAILEAMSRGIDSKTAIMKKTGLADAVVVRLLAQLVEGKKIVEKKSGKRRTYALPEPEPEKSDETESTFKKKKDTGKPKKAAKASPESEKKPEPPIEEITLEPPKEDVPSETTAQPGVIVLDDAPEETEPEVTPEPEAEPEATKEEVKPAESEPEPEPEKKPEPKRKKKGKKPAENKEDEKEPSPAPESQAIDDIPVVKKPIEELSDEEMRVLDAITPEGLTLSGIQSRVKHMKRFALLRALRVLIDSGHVGIVAKGRMELYQRINVQQMDKSDNRKNKQEVK